MDASTSVALLLQVAFASVHLRSELLGVQALRSSTVATFAVGVVVKT